MPASIALDIFRSMHPFRRGAWALLLLPLASLTAAQNVRLSHGGTVAAFEVTPDERAVVYAADADLSGVFELFRRPVSGGGPPRKLNSPFAAFVDLLTFQLTADGTRVVYAADQDVNSTFELYSVPLDGSQNTVKLSAPLVVDQNVSQFFSLTPDGSRAIYTLESPLYTNAPELFSVPVDGSQPATRLAASPFLFGDISFLVSPDSSRVVFEGALDVAGQYELYSVPSDGSQAPTRLSGTLVPGGHVREAQITSDSARVVFRGDLLTDEVFELFSVPITGGNRTRLNPPLVSGGNVQSFQVTPDAIGVVYLANQDVNYRVDLYGVPFGGSAFRYNDPLGQPGVGTFRISPDDAYVVFTAYQQHGSDQQLEFYSVPIDHSRAPRPLNGPLVAGGDVAQTFWFSPDSRRVLYSADQDVDDSWGLYSVPIEGGLAPLQLTRLPVNAGGIPEAAISADGRWALFVKDTDASFRRHYELFRVPMDGSEPPMRLSGPMVHGGDVLVDPWWEALAWRTTSRGRVLYIADQRVNELFELYASPIDAPPLPLH